MLDKLRFTTLQLEDSTLREKDPQEFDDTVQAFLNLRPDGFALNVTGTPQSWTSLAPPKHARVGKWHR